MDVNPIGVSGAEYRQAMRAFATGVAIVACGEGDARAGCVATAVASLSLSPPSLIVNLQRGGSTYRRLNTTARFSVNFLAAAQESLARAFAGGAPAAERFRHGEWTQGQTGAPLLADALAAVECEVEEILERHTHGIVIGRVLVSRAASEGAPLVHFRGRYARF